MAAIAEARTEMASTAKLYYFHGRGRSQQARWALAAAGIAFTNVCLSTAECVVRTRNRLYSAQISQSSSIPAD